jgi:pimeloyl-ACP methyl ester carboxylesterase
MSPAGGIVVGRLGRAVLVVLCLASAPAWAQTERVVDIPTRPGVTQRLLVLGPENPKAAVILFAGGHGGLMLTPQGEMRWGKGNFLVRTRTLFAQQGLLVAVLDAPSDHQAPPYLSGFRQTREHATDVKAVIAWLKKEAAVPVWLVGTSRGTQSAASLATALPLADGGPDGIVLTSSILTDPRGRPVPDMPIDRIKVPVLVVHHKLDGCASCRYADINALMGRLTATPRKELLTFDGGTSKGDPCEAFAYHGYAGIEGDVVAKIGAWVAR